ncbi:peptidase S15 [Paraburkholderia phytofirmans OLGA172]|uniref:Peptidase S15 n=1 Tax=Paraburkholderia phytofirmans OLGA172 TaxID=1417228 RepID=A0A160FTJ8_9BURK|nr:CocE/NonD family hydrolase [Paraburkholderia phytofirmans]ANB76515.1 peptidase S15 [Paraburkholderia phytofirmans OLGA172]
MTAHKTEERDGMVVEWDVSIVMNDGNVLKADIFRPLGNKSGPIILSYGPYGKGLSFQKGYPTAWKILEEKFPDAVRGSSNLYQNWEVVDPEKWVRDGYVCIRVDSRGAGRSDGVVDNHSLRETQDLYECIEWAALQPWSNGKVGLAGVSYFATNQWRVAALQPPHLAAICVWEGYADRYRDSTHHGGILCTFARDWQEMQVKTVQNGLGERGPRSVVTNELVCGDLTLSDEALTARRVPSWKHIEHRHFDDDYYRQRSPDFSKITVPLLSAGNWGGHGLHLRGNIEGFMRSASTQKWLEVHDGEHWAEFYTDYGVGLQKEFFDHFLKGADNGWEKRDRVQLRIRHVDGGHHEYHSTGWPLPETKWTPLYLDLLNGALSPTPASVDANRSFEAKGDGLDFLTAPLEQPMVIAGPLAANLLASSSTTDADIFIVMRIFDPDGEEVVFQGALDPHMPLGQGWLRASHRELDEELSKPWRPYHAHLKSAPLVPGTPVPLNVEIWPTSLLVPAGYRVGLTVRGKDYEYSGEAAHLSNMKNPLRGCGPFLHEDAEDRPASVFSGTTTLHQNGAHSAYVLLPVIPASAMTKPAA